ncbi:MAG: type III pantothenate kinase [Alphaproteobacteria bacterium]
MLLAVDIGNTNTVLGVFRDADKLDEWRIATRAERTADEIAATLSRLMELGGLDLGALQSAIVASVVPLATPHVVRMCRRYLKFDPMVVGQSELDLGIQVLIDRPDQVGADRIVNAVGGHARYPGPLLLIDFGTATTFDVIDADGNYRGGVFAPGINHSVNALYAVAAKLPRIEIKATPTIIGKSTVPAMQSGVYWGYIAMIEGLSARIQEEFGAPMTVIATGGLATLFNEHCEAIHKVDPDLTLHGLWQIHRRNAGRPAGGSVTGQ